MGFDPQSRLRHPSGNFRSVFDNPATVDRYIADEVSTGRLVASTSPSVRRNPIGIIPKPHQPGKFRLIVDLSAPQGFSINDGISPSLCSLEYVSADQAARMVAACGRGALMAKTDLRSAYRQCTSAPKRSTSAGHRMEWTGVL